MLADGLRRWRVRIARARALALVRRWLLVALLVAALLWAVGASLLVTIVAPGALLLIACGVLLRHRPSLSAVARLLDERLALSERLATAWELSGVGGSAGSAGRSREGGPAGSAGGACAVGSAGSAGGARAVGFVSAPELSARSGGDGDALATRVAVEAQQALARSLRTHRARVRRAPREWMAVLAAAGILAAVALIASDANTFTRTSPDVLAQRGRAGGPASGGRRTAHRGGRRGGSIGGTNVSGHSPYSNGDTRRLFDQLRRQPHLSYTSPGLRPDVANAGAAPLRQGQSGTASENGQSSGQSSDGAVRSAAGGGGGESGGDARGGQIEPVSEPQTLQGAADGGRASTPGAGGGAAATPGAGGRPQGASGRTSQPPGGGQSSSSSPSAATGGAPTGGTEAGHQRGTTQRAPGARRQQTAGDLGLPLQGEFAPGRPGGGAAKPGDEGSGGGGRSRSQQVAGAGAAAGGAFPYIPSAATPLGRDQQTLLLDYLRALTQLAGRSG